ncbi:type 1 glutamine amidotransferase [Pseudonocardia parietis]|uniref:GMP synthase (Glutamine-hydrolyzing) n=1 Tax=Pseudonocardia parietis TaxID=570936 RepID=A0ABS4VPN0_9PSEU|nr:type 1 glutamine amidotransferase [Pseudonocardia parietis]MBP2365883.1 GMP synthase (glutamine-hydrolyzing) [Pseudonocardia parietis]
MTTIAVITHVDRADVGLVDEVARERGHECRIVRPYRGERLSELDEVGAVVALGGPQAAYEDHPYLADEERFLSEAVGADVPVLAICLGSQVLARALGGAAHPGGAGLEAGIIDVKPADAASGGIAGRFFSFHSDSMTPPASAEVLAASDRYVQAWALGSALAVQFHPEMTLAGVNELLGLEGPKLERFGADVAAMQAEAERYFAAGAPDARDLLDHWFDLLPSDRSRH